jgi:hypothetical protein
VAADVDGPVAFAATSVTVTTTRTAATAMSAPRSRERLPLSAAVHLRFTGMLRSSKVPAAERPVPGREVAGKAHPRTDRRSRHVPPQTILIAPV